MELTKVDGLNCDDFLCGDDYVKTEKKRQKKTISYYTNAMENKNVLKITFPCASNNTLYLEENGVRIELPAEDFISSDGRKRRALINKEYAVVVTGVDTEKKLITVSSREIVDVAKAKFTEAIDAALDRGDKFYVRARVEGIRTKQAGSRVYINIAGVDIVGYIPINEWSHSYTHSLKYVAEKGEIITVAVIGRGKMGETEAYICSRKDGVDDDVWKDVETRYPVGSNVVIVCTDRRSHNWFGRIQGLTDIEVYCEYPDKGAVDRHGKPIEIKSGSQYNCFIYRSDSAKKILKARPLYEFTD